MRKDKAINTFSVKLDQEAQQVRLDWNGKAETLKDAINVMESVFNAPKSVLEQVRKLEPLNLMGNRMVTKTFSLI